MAEFKSPLIPGEPQKKGGSRAFSPKECKNENENTHTHTKQNRSDLKTYSFYISDFQGIFSLKLKTKTSH